MGRGANDPSPETTSTPSADPSGDGGGTGAGGVRFRSAKLSRPTFLGSIGLVVMMTVCWAFIAVSVDIIRRSEIRRELNSDALSIIPNYVELFKGLDGAGRAEASSGLLTLLAGVATVALALGGLTWRKQDLPDNARMHDAWLRRVVDTSVREFAAVLLMAALCGAYGFIVVCYGFLVGAHGWRGLGLPFFIILLALYVVVATLPAFIPKSDAGQISGYASVLIEIVNLAEWRYRDQRDGAIVGGGEEIGGWYSRLCGWLRGVVAFFCRGCSGLRGLVGKFAGFIAATMVAVPATALIYGGVKCKWVPIVVLVFLFGLVLLLEWAVWQAVIMRVQVISGGRVSFDVVFLSMLYSVVSLLIWVLCVVLIVRDWRGLMSLLVLFVWWLCRVLMALSLKPWAEEDRRGRRWLEETVGLRSEVDYRLDQVLLKDKARLDLYSQEGARIPDELAAVADLVAPKSYVMRRSSESESLREYLSDIVGLSLPSMLVRRDALPQSTKPFVMPRGGSGKRR